MKKRKKSRKQQKQTSILMKYRYFGIGLGLVLCVAAVLFFFFSQKGEETYAVDGSAVKYEASIKKPEGLADNVITFPAYADVQIKKGTEIFPIVLVNPDFNKAYIQFVVSIDRKKVPLLTTGLVEPGKAITGVTLPKDISEGNHEIHLEMLGYSQGKEPTRLSGTKTSFMLTVR